MKLSDSQLRVLRAAKRRRLIKLRISPNPTWFIEGGEKCSAATVRALFTRELLHWYVDGSRVYAVPTDAGRAALREADGGEQS